MWDWVFTYLAQLQQGIVRTLATELRAGGVGTAAFAFFLGALHALTPGHGKIVLVAYFLGRDARIGKGLWVALSAALLHVLTGLAVFLILKFVIAQAPSITGRPSSGFTVFGYGLLVVAGVIMLYQSLRPAHADHPYGTHALTAGMGLLPCPLTITVLGFAWTQSSAAMVGIVLISLALGISLTFAAVALLAILARRGMGAALAGYLPALDRGARTIQAIAGIAIIVIGLATVLPLVTAKLSVSP